MSTGWGGVGPEWTRAEVGVDDPARSEAAGEMRGARGEISGRRRARRDRERDVHVKAAGSGQQERRPLRNSGRDEKCEDEMRIVFVFFFEKRKRCDYARKAGTGLEETWLPEGQDERCWAAACTKLHNCLLGFQRIQLAGTKLLDGHVVFDDKNSPSLTRFFFFLKRDKFNY